MMRRALFILLLLGCGRNKEKPAPQITTPLATASDAAPIVSTAPMLPPTVLAGPCTLGVVTDLVDDDEGEIIGTRIASTREVVLAEWERRGHDEVEGWNGAKPHFASIDVATFPSAISHQAVSVSSAVAAPYAIAAPIGGDRIATLVYGEGIDWSFELSGGPFDPKAKTSYVPPSFVPNSMEAAGAESSALRAVAITTGHDLGGKRVEDCFENATGLPPCNSTLFSGASEFAVIGFPRTGAPWTKAIPIPVPIVPGERYTELGPLAVALGSSSGAYAFRYKDALWVGFLGMAPADVTAPIKIRDGKLGAPAMAMSGDELLVMWSERERDADPWRLASMRFDASRKPGPVELGERGFAPSLASRGDRIALAWMDGDPKKVGFLHAVAWKRGDKPILAGAPDLTPRTGNARDPEITLSGERAFVVWQEVSSKSVVRAASLSCDTKK